MTTLTQQKSRLFFLDNLKVLVIALVIVHHVGQAYGATGGGWPIGNPDRVPNLGILFALDRSFFMSIFFMIAGYFIPASFDRKGALQYTRDRFIRLGVPIVFFLLIVYAVMGYLLGVYYHHYEHIPFWQYYWQFYWGVGAGPGDGPQANLGPLWFISLLLVYSICYALLRQFRQFYKKTADYLQNCSLNKILIPNILIIIVLTFIIRIWFPIDKWLDLTIFAVAPADFIRDTAFFILGIVAFRRNLFFTISRKQGYIWLAIAILLAIFYIVFRPITGEGFFKGGGISLKALRFDIWEAIYCTGMCIGLPVLFREVFNWTNKLWSTLAADAFAAYLFHFPIVIIVQYFFVTVNIGPLSKFFIVSLLAVPLTFFVAHWIRKISGVKRVI